MQSKIILALLINLIFQVNIFSQTHIPHNSEVNGKWTVAKSPYVVEGRVIVPVGKELIIEPGVEIKFNALYKKDYKSLSKKNRGCLQVEGTLKAVGTASNPIILTRTGSSEQWGAIYLKNADNSEIAYCNIDYAGGLTDLGGPNQDAFGAISIQNCNPTISNVKINNVETGVYTSEGASPIIKNSVITNCAKSALVCVEKSNPTIQNTVISKSLFGIRCEGSNPILINCNILYNQSYGFVLHQLSKPQISNCIVWGNGSAFEVYYKMLISQSIIQNKIAKIITGKNKGRLKENNIIGLPRDYPNLNSMLIETNLLELEIAQNNVKGIYRCIIRKDKEC